MPCETADVKGVAARPRWSDEECECEYSDETSSPNGERASGASAPSGPRGTSTSTTTSKRKRRRRAKRAEEEQAPQQPAGEACGAQEWRHAIVDRATSSEVSAAVRATVQAAARRGTSWSTDDALQWLEDQLGKLK